MILGPIVWSPKTETQHRDACVVPISDPIQLESLHFFRLLYRVVNHGFKPSSRKIADSPIKSDMKLGAQMNLGAESQY